MASSLLHCYCPSPKPSLSSRRRLGTRCSSSRLPQLDSESVKKSLVGLKQCALSIALAFGLVTGVPQLDLPAYASPLGPVLPDLAVLISGPPIKDPGALLRYALPIDNKAIREVQKPLEDITDSLKIAGVKALDSVERNLRQASRALSQGKTMILAGVAEPKKAHGQEMLDKLAVGMDELQRIVEDRNRNAVASKQKELLQYVGNVEEDMVDGFPYEIPDEYKDMPLLKGRATVDMKVKVKDNPNVEDCVFRIVLDGYNAPVTAGNFVDLVERRFYDGMEIQRADGFVVQTGDPEGPAEGFIDPSTEKVRTVPLEIMVVGDKAPVYGETLEELGRYKAQTKLPFNAFGTMAMAREEFDDNSGSSQVFWLLKESELTPSLHKYLPNPKFPLVSSSSSPNLSQNPSRHGISSTSPLPPPLKPTQARDFLPVSFSFLPEDRFELPSSEAEPWHPFYARSQRRRSEPPVIPSRSGDFTNPPPRPSSRSDPLL